MKQCTKVSFLKPQSNEGGENRTYHTSRPTTTNKVEGCTLQGTTKCSNSRAKSNCTHTHTHTNDRVIIHHERQSRVTIIVPKRDSSAPPRASSTTERAALASCVQFAMQPARHAHLVLNHHNGAVLLRFPLHVETC